MATKKAKEAERALLLRLLESDAITAGMLVRAHGDHLIVSRPYEEGDDPDDRVRLTAVNGSRYGLSVRRHTGRWERTPFEGSMEEMVDVMRSVMQHLVAHW